MSVSKEEKDFFSSMLTDLTDLEGPLSTQLQVLSEDRRIQGNIDYNPVVEHKPLQKVTFVVSEELLSNKTNIKSYSVKIKETNQIIVDGIVLAECINFVINHLNAGKTISDPKVLGIISCGIQHTSVIKEMLNISMMRQKVLRESNYDKAKEYDSSLLDKKTQAEVLKEKVIKFIKGNN